jgi:hypothetical protein
MATEAETKPVSVEEKQEDAPVVAAESGDAAPAAAVQEEAINAADSAPADAEETQAKEVAAKQLKPTVHKVNYEKDVVYLYQFSRTPLLPSMSPYCLKVETWLRLVGLKYEVSFFYHFY